MADQPNPHPTDLYVGSRIRFRRRTLKISQEKLAESLGLTFQQIQKYERGANRVSASKLQEIASSLDTSVGYFFEGLPSAGGEAKSKQDSADSLSRFLASAENLELVSLLPKLSTPVRRHLLGIARALAKGDGEDSPEARK
jgi:transcriptional regulator with XRE-family HTH domain